MKECRPYMHRRRNVGAVRRQIAVQFKLRRCTRVAYKGDDTRAGDGTTRHDVAVGVVERAGRTQSENRESLG